MSDNYGIDLAAFRLDTLRDFLAHGDLLPSHRVLRDNLDAHFAALAAGGIANVQQIVNTLTTPKAVERFASKTGIPLDYLTILRRHVRGYIPNPVNFAEIPGIAPQVVEQLAEVGIKHTKHLFEQARTYTARVALAQRTGIAEAVMLELIQLTDLARIGWVGPIGVRLFHAAGAVTVTALLALNLDTFYAQVIAVNQERQYMKVKLTRKDIALCVDMAKKLPNVIEYERS
jgi:hypothetical protein